MYYPFTALVPLFLGDDVFCVSGTFALEFRSKAAGSSSILEWNILQLSWLWSIFNYEGGRMDAKRTIDDAMRVLKLSHAQRYKHFIKKSVETYIVYTINIGANYIVVNNVAGTSMCCPLWPAAIFAELWIGPSDQGAAGLLKAEIVSIELNALLNHFLPALKQRGLKAGICFDRATDGPVEPVNKVIADIKSEIRAVFSYQFR